MHALLPSLLNSRTWALAALFVVGACGPPGVGMFLDPDLPPFNFFGLKCTSYETIFMVLLSSALFGCSTKLLPNY